MRRAVIPTIALLLAAVAWGQVSPVSVVAQDQHGGTPSQSAGPLPRALWVWKPALLEDPAELESLLAFSARRRIGTIFLSAPTKRLQDEAGLYRRVLRRAHAQGIRVQALNGEPEWLFPDQRSKAAAFLEALQHYSQQSPPEERFDAVHLDVEPQSLEQWKAGERSQLAAPYLAFLGWFRNRARPLGLPLVVDIPVSFNQISAGAKTLSQAALDRVDQVVVMAYKDSTEKVLVASRAEVEYGETVGKEVWVGLSADPAHLPSGSPGGPAALEGIAGEVEEAYRPSHSFLGVAIHDYQRYRRLIEGEK